MGGYGMAAKMRELTDRQMLDFVKELEKRRIPLHNMGTYCLKNIMHPIAVISCRECFL